MKNKDYEQLATKIMMNALEGVTAQIRKAYDKGYKDGQAETPFTDTEEAEKRAYEDGMNLAWECARKMCLMSSEERLRAFDVSGNHLAILSDVTVSKAIEKLKAFEQKQKCKECKKTKDPIFYGHCVGECDYAKQTEDEIKVGDEVVLNANATYNNEKSIILACDESIYPYNVLMSNGDTEWIKKDVIERKTGRHFPQIAEVLAEMRGAE